MSHDAHRRLQLMLVLGLLAAVAANQQTPAQTPPAPWLPLPPLRAKLELVEPRPAVVIAKPAAPREAGWQEFEANFGIAEPSRSAVLGAIQAAKYRVDEVVYGTDRFIRGLSRALEFEYRNGQWNYGPTLANEKSPARMARVFENTKVKFDIAFQDGGPYLGMRLVVPVGR